MVYALRAWDKAEEFGAWLASHRRDTGKTQEEVARIAGCSKGYISFLERAAASSLTGKPMRPTDEMAESIARALGRPEDEGRLMAGYAPSDVDWTMDMPGPIQNSPTGLRYEPIDYAAYEAFLRGLPPHMQQEEYDRLRRTFMDFIRGQTDFGKKADED